MSTARRAWAACVLIAAVAVGLPLQAATPDASLAALQAHANPLPGSGPEQPIPFSHQLHAAKGLPCVLCHTGPSPAGQMTLPQADTCLNCHRVIAADRPAIQKLAATAAAKTPIAWQRVYQVAPGVTWSHAPHLQAGVTCAGCHGAVESLPVMSALRSPHTMGGCVDCHAEASRIAGSSGTPPASGQRPAGARASTRCETCHAAWSPDNTIDRSRFTSVAPATSSTTTRRR